MLCHSSRQFFAGGLGEGGKRKVRFLIKGTPMCATCISNVEGPWPFRYSCVQVGLFR